MAKLPACPVPLQLHHQSLGGGDNAPNRCRSMRRLLTVTAAVVALLGGPAMAQWGGGDGSQAGATAWCAARAAGKNPNQASWAASNALVNSMGGGFASNIATIITGGRTMRDSLEYLIRKQCPEYIGGDGGAQTAAKSELDDPSHPSFCNWHPWATECKNKSFDSGNLAVKKVANGCHKVIEKYECSYQKYLSANPSVESWAKANPTMAKKEAIRLSAIDAEEIALPAVKEASAKIEAQPSAKDIENKCLKASDYKGCMEYNFKK